MCHRPSGRTCMEDRECELIGNRVLNLRHALDTTRREDRWSSRREWRYFALSANSVV